MFSGRLARYRKLAAGESAAAQDADALIIERIPSPAPVYRLQDPEFLFWKEMKIHTQRCRD